MVLNADRVVEEHHQTVAGEVLERALVVGDQPAERFVVVTEDVEELLWCSCLGEGCEASQIAEEAGDVRAVSGEELPAFVGCDQLRDLGGEEPRELRSLTLDRVEQAGISDCYRGLVGECLEQDSLIVAEGSLLCSHDDHDSEQVALDHHGNAEHRAKMSWPGIAVLLVLEDVRDMNGLLHHGYSAGDRRAVEPMWMLAVMPTRLGAALMGNRVQDPVSEQPERAVIGSAESAAGLDYLVEDRL